MPKLVSNYSMDRVGLRFYHVQSDQTRTVEMYGICLNNQTSAMESFETGWLIHYRRQARTKGQSKNR